MESLTEPTERFLSSEEAKQLALDMFHNKVFCSDQMQRMEDLPMVFMPLALMDKEGMEKFLATKPVVIYEYISKAGPVSVNGYPVFFSCKSLNKADYEAVRGYEDALRRATEEALGRVKPEENSGSPSGENKDAGGNTGEGNQVPSTGVLPPEGTGPGSSV